jgi:hypothetical protein
VFYIPAYKKTPNKSSFNNVYKSLLRQSLCTQNNALYWQHIHPPASDPVAATTLPGRFLRNSVQEFFIKSWHSSSSSMKGRSKACLLRGVNDSLHILSTFFVWYGLNSKDVHKILCYPYPAYSVVFNKSPNTRTQ